MSAPLLDRFADKYCLELIEKAVARFVEDNYNKLEVSSRTVQEPESASLEDFRIEFTTNVQTYGDLIGFDVAVSAEIEICETVRGYDKSDSITQWFRVPLQIRFEEKVVASRISDGKGGGVEIYAGGAKKRSPIGATSNLVPVIYGEDYDGEATKFLKKYCPEALETAMPTPLDKIVEAMGIPKINYDNHLSPDFSVYGKICFADEEVEVYSRQGIPETIQAKRGQIFVDPDTSILCSVGCLHNTVAHELFHWHRHRLYATLKRLLDGAELDSTRCRVRSQGATRRKDEELTDEEWMELHANSISPRILMPIETVKRKAKEALTKYGYDKNSPDSEEALRAVIAELAAFYKVSKQLATIRLAQLGSKEAQDIFDADYDRNILCSSQVPQTDILREYKENERFRKTIESGLFRYAEGRFVINDPKYINKADGGIYILTEYARTNLGECVLRFNTVITGDIEYRGDGFYRTNKANFATVKKFVESAATMEAAEDFAAASDAFKNEAERHRALLKAVGSGSTFSESFNALMDAYFAPLGILPHKYSAEVFEATGITQKVYGDMKRGDYEPSHRTVTALCAGLDLDVSIAEALLQKSGKSFSQSDEHIALRAILTAYRGYDINERNDYLKAMGHGTLTAE